MRGERAGQAAPAASSLLQQPQPAVNTCAHSGGLRRGRAVLGDRGGGQVLSVGVGEPPGGRCGCVAGERGLEWGAMAMAFLFCCLVVVCRFGGLECVVVEVSCRRGGGCSSHAAPASKAARRRRLSCRRSRSPHNVSWHPYPSGGWRPLFQGPPSNPLRVGAVSWGIVSKDRKGSNIKHL